MNETLQFVLKHGYLVLFAWVFAEQIVCRCLLCRCCSRPEHSRAQAD